MNLRENLNQLNDIKKETKELENKIEKLEKKLNEIVSDSVETTTKYFPIIQTHYVIKGIDKKRVQQLENYKTLLEKRYDKLIELKIQLEKFINEMPTSRIRRIFTYKYIDEYPWIKVAQLIGGNATEDSVKQEYYRFLEKSEVCHECHEIL